MSGLVRSRRAMPAKPPRAVVSSAPRPALIILRSAPAEKTGGTPVRMVTHRSSSPSTRSMAASMPFATSSLTALRAWGRLMVTTATWPSMVTSMLIVDYFGCRRAPPSMRMTSAFM
jgi:hypothetical protein